MGQAASSRLLLVLSCGVTTARAEVGFPMLRGLVNGNVTTYGTRQDASRPSWRPQLVGVSRPQTFQTNHSAANLGGPGSAACTALDYCTTPGCDPCPSMDAAAVCRELGKECAGVASSCYETRASCPGYKEDCCCY